AAADPAARRAVARAGGCRARIGPIRPTGCKTGGGGMRGMAAALCLWLGGVALGQEDAIPGGGADRLRFEYVHYRPAVWEEEALREKENERPNRGGLIYAYFTNVSPE